MSDINAYLTIYSKNINEVSLLPSVILSITALAFYNYSYYHLYSTKSPVQKKISDGISSFKNIKYTKLSCHLVFSMF